MNKLVRIKLTEEEKALLKKLRDSITPETKKEWGENEMKSNNQFLPVNNNNNNPLYNLCNHQLNRIAYSTD